MTNEPIVADTIAAIATPPGRGGIGVIRISGPAAPAIAKSLSGSLPKPRVAALCRFAGGDKNAIDEGILIYFAAPNSFTGEEVVELQGHGGPVVQDMLLQAVVELGARLARPGEFSERAFLNGKLDLAQAEAVADLIESGSTQAARSALKSLQGAFSKEIHQLVELLTRLRVYVEAAIDFPEEEIDFLADNRVGEELAHIEKQFEKLLAATKQGCILHDGMTVVLVGKPNVGKSSLLNALAGQDSAIVSDIPGTTRDIIREHIQIDGMPVHVLDTAGLRDSGDEIETEGVRRAKAAMEKADRVLVIVDDNVTSDDELEKMVADLPCGGPCTVVRNKIDLTNKEPTYIDTRCYKEVAVSAKTGAGLDKLRQHLKDCMGFQASGEGTFMARRRHLDAIERAQAHLAEGKKQLQESKAGELLAEELRLAQKSLGEITGEVTSDDLLGEIFSSFCIGK
ncbi:MAG: tRNA uridine-5-carboxymethylaminomethyl(34) synthesis GTPase MnmE [Acidiferrobacterales bacterium]